MSPSTTLVNAFLAEECTPAVSAMLQELLRTRTHGDEQLTLDTFTLGLDFDTNTVTITDHRGEEHADHVRLPDFQDALELHRAHPWA